MSALLTKLDPSPFRVIKGSCKVPILLVCDHASNLVPEKLNNLGLPQAELNRHIGFDLGAKEVAIRVAKRLGATIILANYSRLVIDINRSLDHKGLIEEESDGTVILLNKSISNERRQERINEIYWPYHHMIDKKLKELDKQFKQQVTLLTIHSFTPKLRAKLVDRPWEISIAWRDDVKTAQDLITHLRNVKNRELIIGRNQPFTFKQSHTIINHTEDGRSHSHIELRNDVITKPSQQKFFADIIYSFYKKQSPIMG